MVSICRCCHRSFEAFICFVCGQAVNDLDKRCHERFIHQGKHVSYGTFCPKCKQITKAPSPEMIDVFYYTTFTDWSNSEISTKLHRSERTVNWLKNNMVRRCLWCENPILPPDEMLLFLFLLVAKGKSQNDTAIILSKMLEVKVSRYRVRSTIEKCKKDYGIDPYTVQNPKAICQKLIYDVEVLLKEKRRFDP